VIYATTTDNDGHFEIKQVEAGRYRFMASHVSYLEQGYKAKGVGGGAELSLADTQEISGVLFRLVPAGVIRGRGGRPHDGR
jgi:hypothetical protein